MDHFWPLPWSLDSRDGSTIGLTNEAEEGLGSKYVGQRMKCLELNALIPAPSRFRHTRIVCIEPPLGPALPTATRVLKGIRRLKVYMHT